MGHAEEDRQGQKRDDETETARFQFAVKVSNGPPKSLEQVSVGTFGISHNEEMVGVAGYLKGGWETARFDASL